MAVVSTSKIVEATAAFCYGDEENGHSACTSGQLLRITYKRAKMGNGRKMETEERTVKFIIKYG